MGGLLHKEHKSHGQQSASDIDIRSSPKLSDEAGRASSKRNPSKVTKEDIMRENGQVEASCDIVRTSLTALFKIADPLSPPAVSPRASSTKV